MRDTWTQLQRAETMLFGAAVMPKVNRYRKILEGFKLEVTLAGWFIRMVNGFNPNHITAEDYFSRYPFSSVEAITVVLNRLEESGHLKAKTAGGYTATELGRKTIQIWQEKIGELMQEVDLGDMQPEKIQKLIKYDLSIIDAIKIAKRPHGYPIFNHRLSGLHPSYDSPRLWHHWQLVWTMLAASEDEEEYVRRKREIPPLEWFVRRQIWFIHRRPWRARARTLKELAARATGYSPFNQAEEVCASAITAMKNKGWVQKNDEEFQLTKTGLAVCDDDEHLIDEYLLSSWPDFRNTELLEISGITNQLNERFEVIIAETIHKRGRD